MPLYEYRCRKCKIDGIELQIKLVDVDKVILCRNVMEQVDNKKKCCSCNEVLVRNVCPVPFKLN